MDTEIKKKLLEELMGKMGQDDLKKIPMLTISIGMGGGKHGQDDKPDETESELEKGTEIEMEHTDDPKEAMKIAQDHLDENPTYYSDMENAGLSENEEEDGELDPRIMELIKKKMLTKK